MKAPIIAGCVAMSLALLLPAISGSRALAHPIASAALDVADDSGQLETGALNIWAGDGGKSMLDTRAGRPCWTIPMTQTMRYIYVRSVDKRFHGGSSQIRVTVEAIDGEGDLVIEYDSYLFPWKRASRPMTNTGKWKAFDFNLPDAAMSGRCNGADFRITASHPVSLTRVRVEHVKRAIEPDRFPTRWDEADLDRVTADRIGFSHGGMHWGEGGMTPAVYERELDLMADLGFGWLRYWAEWAEVEASPGEYRWANLDYRVAEAKRRGLRLIGAVHYGTPWASDAPEDVKGHARTKYPPRDLADMQRYARAMIGRYKNDVQHWEGWNEANANGFWNVPPSGRDRFEHYVQWQRAFYEAAKQADPDCIVLTGGFADGADLARQLVRYYEAGLKDTFDVMNVHIYGGDPRGKWTVQQIQSVIRVMRHHGDGDKPIWITETGWPVECVHPNVRSLDQQAQWTPWLFAVLLSHPQVERVFFHELRDIPSDANYGWLRGDFQPRPVVEQWRAMQQRGHSH